MDRKELWCLLGKVRRRAVPFRGPNSTDIVEIPSRGFYRRIEEDCLPRWAAWKGTQVTESENHPSWRDPGREAGTDLTDDGGNFTTERRSIAAPVNNPGRQRVSSGWYLNSAFQQQRDTYWCTVLPRSPASMPFPPSARSSEMELMALGTTAIARCAPTNNVASLATGLSELYREGLPRMFGASQWQSRAQNIRDLYKASGDEYLKVQFGWKPLLADISDTAYGIVRSRALMEQALRDSGRVVRRRYSFPPISSIDETVTEGLSAAKVAGSDRSSLYNDAELFKGRVTRIRETTKAQWFSGAFTYHLPDYGSGLLGQARQANQLLGLSVTPEVMWNLTPWSWAVDWFSNVGDVIHNVQQMASNGLVLRYGYIMEHSIVSDTYMFSGPTGFKSSGVNPLVVKVVTETKLRRKATPFGFGLSLGGLSFAQKAILAALGMSRA